LILTEHGRHFPDQVSRLRYWVNRLGLSRLADDVNAVCKFSARALCERDGFARAPVGVIPNGIDPERYGTTANRAALRARLGLDANRDYVIHVARMHPVKDHPTLLHAFAQVATTHANVDLLLAGDGPGRDDLEALAARLGISARVRFLGVRQDVPDLLNAADIFTLPSISEAASLTLLEAMAAGLPAVVTDVGGNGEIVRAGVDGLLVPRGDASALAQAFRRLLDDPSERTRMGRSGQERVRSDYRLDNTIDAYMSMYQRFVRTRGR
jgi:glycosyltransferase involved in cell wall biosynthesis